MRGKWRVVGEGNVCERRVSLRERERRGAHVQLLHAGFAVLVARQSLERVSLHSFSPPCAPDARLAPERTLQVEESRETHHGIRNTTGTTRGKDLFLRPFSLFWRLFFLSISLFLCRLYLSMSLNSFWRDWREETWGLFFFLGTFLGCIPPFGGWHRELFQAQCK